MRKPGSIVSSNTSTIPLRALSGKQSDAFKADFCITHFFNPPRYMRLLELVSGPDTRSEVTAELAQLCDVRLGKGVVHCKDTPGFIANRIGTYWITCAVNEAIARGVTVEEADAAHRPMGIPKTGVFGLVDLVGLDLMPLIAKSLLATLPPDDDFRRIARDQPLLTRMIAEGRIGRKAKGGFYRLGKNRQKEALDLLTGEYQPGRQAQAGRRGRRTPQPGRARHPPQPGRPVCRRGAGAGAGLCRVAGARDRRRHPRRGRGDAAWLRLEARPVRVDGHAGRGPAGAGGAGRRAAGAAAAGRRRRAHVLPRGKPGGWSASPPPGNYAPVPRGPRA